MIIPRQIKLYSELSEAGVTRSGVTQEKGKDLKQYVFLYTHH